MKKIAVSNRKGGVGKTTIAYNLGASLIASGSTVLFVDMDSQCNLTGLCDVQSVDLDRWKTGKPETINDRLSILPGSKNFSQLENEISQLFDRNSYLKGEILPRLPEYDYLIFDTPPALNVLNVNVFVASDTVLIPVNPDSFSLEGLQEMEAILKQVQTVNSSLTYQTVLNGYFSRQTFSGISRKYLKEYPAYSGVEIPHRAEFAKSIAQKRPAIAEEELFNVYSELRKVVA